jgi:hypothetical protein
MEADTSTAREAMCFKATLDTVDVPAREAQVIETQWR